MRKRSGWWLAGALVLLGAAAWLFGGRTPEAPPSRAVEIPRRMDEPARERMVRRRSLSVAPAALTDAGEAPASLDPVLAALPPRGTSKVTMVLEANALVNSAIGQALLECLSPRQAEAMADLERATGVDVLHDVDRVAATDGVFMASGSFGGVDPSTAMPGGTRGALGEHATIWSPPAERGGSHVVRWKDELVLFGDDKAQLEAAVARLDAAGAGITTGEPALGEGDTYGEVYGTIDPELFGEALPPELAARLREVADRVELHASAQDDVGVVVEVDGSDLTKVEELARSLGGALAVGRVKAAAEGEGELSELLDLARVRRSDGRLAVELALPRPWLEKRVLGPCRERAAAARALQEEGGDEARRRAAIEGAAGGVDAGP